MGNVNYCLECQRVFNGDEKCEFCNSSNVKSLKKGTSVNILGTKSKGKVLSFKNGLISVILTNENKEKIVKEYQVKELKKIL